MNPDTGELKLWEDMTEEERKKFEPVPDEHSTAAKECINKGRSAIDSNDPNFKAWALKKKLAAKSRRKQVKKSRRDNR